MDAYSILGVPYGSSVDECKRAYRKLSKIHHPDRGGNPETFQRISQAWESIKTGKPLLEKGVSRNSMGYYQTARPKYYHTNLFTIKEVV